MLMRELDLSEWMRWMELNEMRLMIIEWRKKSRRGREKEKEKEKREWEWEWEWE